MKSPLKTHLLFSVASGNSRLGSSSTNATSSFAASPRGVTRVPRVLAGVRHNPGWTSEVHPMRTHLLYLLHHASVGPEVQNNDDCNDMSALPRGTPARRRDAAGQRRSPRHAQADDGTEQRGPDLLFLARDRDEQHQRPQGGDGHELEVAVLVVVTVAWCCWCCKWRS